MRAEAATFGRGCSTGREASCDAVRRASRMTDRPLSAISWP